MKKTIRLTENDLIRIVKRVILEQENSDNKINEIKKMLNQSIKDLIIKDEDGFTVFELKNVKIGVNKYNIYSYVEDSYVKSDRIDRLFNDKLNYTRQGMYNHNDVSAKELANIIKQALLMPESKQM